MKKEIKPVYLNGTFGFPTSKNPKEVVIIRATGNRLIHRGIAEGTYLYVELNAKYKDDDVIVVIDIQGKYHITTSLDDTTMKYYGRVFLLMNSFEE